MKGAIFIALNDLIESQYGLEVWDELLDEVKPDCNGVYTSVDDYPDEDIVKFVIAISRKLNIESSQVTQVFGKFLFGELNAKHPIFTQRAPTLFDFLESVEGVIHKEVKKLFENPNLPTLDTRVDSNTLEMKYSSPRKLCYLAEGLIFGAAEHYGENIRILHPQCMHDGYDHCILKIIKNDVG